MLSAKNLCLLSLLVATPLYAYPVYRSSHRRIVDETLNFVNLESIYKDAANRAGFDYGLADVNGDGSIYLDDPSTLRDGIGTPLRVADNASASVICGEVFNLSTATLKTEVWSQGDGSSHIVLECK